MQNKLRTLPLTSIMMAAYLLYWASSSEAALEIVEDAYEVTPRQIVWPTYDEGRLLVRPCNSCEAVALTVNGDTAYYLGFSSPRLSRQELIYKATNGGHFEQSLVYLFYRPDDRHVTRIVLDPGPP